MEFASLEKLLRKKLREHWKKESLLRGEELDVDTIETCVQQDLELIADALVRGLPAVQ